MTAPRLEIDIYKIYYNARILVERLSGHGIHVTGVTKAVLGLPEVASALLSAGVDTLGDSRIENIETMRHAGVPACMTLIRSPMLSQVERVVSHAEVSFNTEIEVVERLSAAAQNLDRTHGIVLMVELGDLREGILPRDLLDVVRGTLSLPNIVLTGIGTNLACRSGTSPDARNMSELSALASSIEETFGITLQMVSGGNSANLGWVLDGPGQGDRGLGRINDLRLGESILLGREPLHRRPIEGLFNDAITLVAEVIESKVKPSIPWGQLGQNAFGDQPRATDRGAISQVIYAVGHQDTDPAGLDPPAGIEIIGASSDHLIVDSGSHGLGIGTETTFELSYGALVRAMVSPFVAKILKVRDGLVRVAASHTNGRGRAFLTSEPRVLQAELPTA